MGLKVENPMDYKLNDDITNFFSLSFEESTQKTDEYEELKNNIYKLDLDNEEKANILNKINSLKIVKSPSEQQKIKKEIDKFKNKYNL